MPCHPAWARGVFYIRLTEREAGETQPIAVGIDDRREHRRYPGAKKEALTVKAETHSYLNIQTDPVIWVSDAEKTNTTMRRSRRQRKTLYRTMAHAALASSAAHGYSIRSTACVISVARSLVASVCTRWTLANGCVRTPNPQISRFSAPPVGVSIGKEKGRFPLPPSGDSLHRANL